MKMRFVYLGLMFVISYFRANGYSEVMPTTRISLPKCFLKESKVLQGTPCTKQDPSPCDSCSGGTCSANFLTSDFCHDYCVKKGYEHFGLQYNLCHCGTFDYSKHYKSINDSMCAYKCQGDPDNKPLVVYCGGHGNVWIQPTKVLSTQPVLNTTLQPELSTEVATSSHFNNQLEVLVNQSTTFSESTTVNDLILFSNKLSNLSISSSSTKVIVNIIDDILEIDDKFQEGQNEERAADASRKIIRLLDDQITTTFEDDANFTVTDNNNIALKAVTFDKNSISTDLQFSATEDNQVLLEFSDTYKYSTDTVVSVTIPADVLISTEVAMTQISFVVFHRSGLFFIDEGSAGQDETVVWREVVRVKEEVTNPEKEFNSNLTYNFQNVTMEGECKDFKARCSYTEALSNVLRNGCETNDNGNGQFSCSCNRFGHVALLLDPVRENIGREHTLVLHFLSIGLFSLSAILLIVIMLVYLSNKKIRQRVQYKVLIGLYFSLAAFDVIYIASNYPPKSKELCKAIGVAVHYFLLSSVMWMGGEVFTLYLNVVPKTKFDQNNVMFVKKVASVCFLLPLVPVTFGAVYSFKTECSKIHQCFKLSEVTFYTALVAPVSLILFVNVVLFIRIIHTLYTSGKATKANKSNKLHRLTRHVFTIFILSGLSWCLAFFSLDYDGSIAFNYLFTIFNGLQGIVIFILFLVLNKDVKKILSKSRVGRSIRYGFRSPPPKSKTNSNLQHFKQNQQISEDPSYSIGVSATNMEYM